MRKYNEKANVIGPIIRKHREELKFSKEEVCRRMQLHGICMHRVELYRIEQQLSILKDFELIALCDILNIDYNKEIKNLID